MDHYPHQYLAMAHAASAGAVEINSGGLEPLSSMPPPQFGGPGDSWSPETLLVAAVADCFILTFRAIARASKLEWSALECSAEGVLERVEGVTRFTGMTVRATLTVPAGTNVDKAQRLLEKSESVCLITQSMTATVHLQADIIVQD